MTRFVRFQISTGSLSGPDSPGNLAGQESNVLLMLYQMNMEFYFIYYNY